MKKILLLIFVFISLNAFAQLYVNDSSFRQIPDAVVEDKLEYTDGNDLPMALIKISMDNISEQEGLQLVFVGNRATQIRKMPHAGQMWIYVSAENATFIDIRHPDYGTFKYTLPVKLCDYCVYEMVLQYIPIMAEFEQSTFVKIGSTPEADIFIDGEYYGTAPKVIKDLSLGDHELKLTRNGCYDLIKTFTVHKGGVVKLNEKLLAKNNIAISTYQNGDKIYLDEKFIGESPVTVADVSYGRHAIKAVRGNKTISEKIDVELDNHNQEYKLVFGKMVTIKSNKTGDRIYVDGKKVGVTPMDLDLSLGTHKVEVKKRNRYEARNINVTKIGNDLYSFYPKKETLSEYLENGYDFLTINYAYSIAPQQSYGLTYGSVKQRCGWFVSVMSNFDFGCLGPLSDSDGEIILTGENRSSRLSLMGGVVVGNGPIGVRCGAGYGFRLKSWEAENGIWYKYADDSYSGLDLSAGLQTNLIGLSLSADFLFAGFKYVEFKLGLGINRKK